ncbi:DNA polymerase [Lamprobacter modestohalophilus]|uniref:DNA polymerase n=1 Tax=Lamprobacter modestohalophilus TaxID=1064514 RepID=UPI002ADED1AF|nr:DNA polymerase [Lamprobacter modestohalophilus]MEA1050485.1 DNA polymerase [Lamprobacter modestohalophilus]
MITIDFEIFGAIDLGAVGATHYARHTETDILLLGYQIDAQAPRVWTPNTPFPEPLRNALAAGQALWAHNAAFDRLIWNEIGTKRYGFPPAPHWHDSMILCALAGLPRSLAEAAKALGLPAQKQTDGKRLIRLFSCPHTGHLGSRVTDKEAPEDWLRFISYCKQDVATTASLIHRLAAFVPDLELDLPCWEADQAMSQRGIKVDLDLASAIAQAAEPLMEAVDTECRSLTGGIGPSQVQALLAWLREQDITLDTLGEIEINELLATDLSPDIRRVLQLRLEGSRSSWRKVYAVQAAVGPDGRLRDQLQYAGTHTYRWKGRGVQLQNLPRPKLKQGEIEQAVKCLIQDPSAFSLLYDKPLETLASLVRALLCAPQGQRLGVSDFSKIEVVVLAWLAGDQDMLLALERGDDLYKQLASRIYQVAISAVTAEQRHVGKGGILGGGYGAGWRAFQASCRKGGLQIDQATAQATITAYRELHAPVVTFWKALERAALRAAQTGEPQRAGAHLIFTREDRWLRCWLPSGRSLSWFDPRIKRVEKFDQLQPELRFSGIGKNGKSIPMHTFGGRLCENVVSSTARDLLAESLVLAEREGLSPVLTVHDEIVSEGPPGIADALGKVMLRRPDWASALPIAAEWKESVRYGK